MAMGQIPRSTEHISSTCIRMYSFKMSNVELSNLINTLLFREFRKAVYSGRVLRCILFLIAAYLLSFS